MLRRTDLDAILAFLGDAGDIEFDEAFPPGMVARLGALVPCDDLSYQDIDLDAKAFLAFVGPDASDPADDADDERRYWENEPCPISSYRSETGDIGTVRMSDLVRGRRFHDLPIYRDYFGPEGIRHVIDLGLPAAPHRHRSFILFRGGRTDFSERDRLVLETLRPHLAHLEAQAALRGRLRDALRTQGEKKSVSAAMDPRLTPREGEIVELVAQGKTNAEIGESLWIAPSTVKKHLENVYVKLGVGRRSAAASLVAGGVRVGATSASVEATGGAG